MNENLSVLVKLISHSHPGVSGCLRCEQKRETFLRNIVQRPGVSEVFAYAENLLSYVRRIQLFAKSILKMYAPAFLTKTIGIFPGILAMARSEVINESSDERKFHIWPRAE